MSVHTPRRRHLRPEEIELWRQVLRSVTPLPGATAPVEPQKVTPPTRPVEAAAAALPVASPPVPARPKADLPPIAPLERRLRQRLARGRTDVDAALDLHGLRQDEAHQRLRHFLMQAQSEGARLVLVVTGKGSSSRSSASIFDEIGILRRNVPHWLRAPDMRRLVVSVEEASATHGGAGALYVRLRRPDRNRS